MHILNISVTLVHKGEFELMSVNHRPDREV